MTAAQPSGDVFSFKRQYVFSGQRLADSPAVISLLSRERGVYGLRNGEHERYRYGRSKHPLSTKLTRTVGVIVPTRYTA